MEFTRETTLQVRLSGLIFPESPRWRHGRLWLADWGAQEIIRLGPDGREEITSDLAAVGAIDHLPDGCLVVVDPVESALMRIENDGSVERVADLAPFGTHPWNDIVVDGRGNAYINNLGFRYPAEEYSPGSIVMVGGDGSIKHVADGLAFPNGMAVTPDNTTLIVAESYGKRLAAFDIEADGSLSNRRTWADVEGHPDGICLDASGAVWYADVPNQRCVASWRVERCWMSLNSTKGASPACSVGKTGGTFSC